MRHCGHNQPFHSRVTKDSQDEDGGGGRPFPRQSVLLERARRIPSYGKLRLMAVRDELKALGEVAKGSTKGMQRVASLLRDEGVAVAPTAADALASVAADGYSIGAAVPVLAEALGNKYAKRNCSAALALHYFALSDFEGLKSLLEHHDEEIRAAAAEACGGRGETSGM
ncbi:MAG: hypothetical protein AB1324_06690 [Candidatus Micrarchaeota archaeon]